MLYYGLYIHNNRFWHYIKAQKKGDNHLVYLIGLLFLCGFRHPPKPASWEIVYWPNSMTHIPLELFVLRQFLATKRRAKKVPSIQCKDQYDNHANNNWCRENYIIKRIWKQVYGERYCFAEPLVPGDAGIVHSFA